MPADDPGILYTVPGTSQLTPTATQPEQSSAVSTRDRGSAAIEPVTCLVEPPWRTVHARPTCCSPGLAAWRGSAEHVTQADKGSDSSGFAAHRDFGERPRCLDRRLQGRHDHGMEAGCRARV